MTGAPTAWSGEARRAPAAQPRCGVAAPADVETELEMDFGQVRAVLDLLAKRRRGTEIDRQDWLRIYATEPYRLLRQRERDVGLAFTDDDFEAFILSSSLSQDYDLLRQAAKNWTAIDVEQAASRALAYLPAGSRLRARIFPVIKMTANSFVYGSVEDAAIFLYLNPCSKIDAVENTLSHELHHIGLATAIAARPSLEDGIRSPAADVLRWLRAFREGFAMLAAAGGLDAHPLADAKPGDRERWDGDMNSFRQNIEALESFFLDALAGAASPEETERRGLSFYGARGPWYTVGWKMSVLVEEAFGREALIECMLDPRLLLLHYNALATANATQRLPSWSRSLIAALY